MISQCDFLIIGGGILGLGTARALHRLKPAASIAIIEKESDVGLHTSGRNSGVLHAGIYYSSSSLKAMLCVRGNQLMHDFCKENGLALNPCGKLIVASSEDQIVSIEQLFSRAKNNGCTVELIDGTRALKIEPHLRHRGPVIYSPLTASVNPAEICLALKRELLERDVQCFCNTRFISHSGNIIETSQGTVEAGHVINTAGLYADVIAKKFSLGSSYEILPVKGLYLHYAADPDAIQTNIYPVPDPRFPFLGIHFNKTYDGTVKIGATAIPCLWREQYGNFENFSLPEFLQISMRELVLFIKNSSHFRALAIEEFKRYSHAYFTAQALQLVHGLEASGFKPHPTVGIRAQLVHKVSGELVQDFVVEGDRFSTHILNAVSPGFTCGLSFGEYIAQDVLQKIQQSL